MKRFSVHIVRKGKPVGRKKKHFLINLLNFASKLRANRK